MGEQDPAVVVDSQQAAWHASLVGAFGVPRLFLPETLGVPQNSRCGRRCLAYTGRGSPALPGLVHTTR